MAHLASPLRAALLALLALSLLGSPALAQSSSRGASASARASSRTRSTHRRTTTRRRSAMMNDEGASGGGGAEASGGSEATPLGRESRSRMSTTTMARTRRNTMVAEAATPNPGAAEGANPGAAGPATGMRGGDYLRRQLVSTGRGSYRTQHGLRISHRTLTSVLRSGRNRTINRPHGVFEGGREQAIPVIDGAWQRVTTARRSNPQLAGAAGITVTQGRTPGTSVYTVDMGERIGYVGGSVMGRPAATRVRLIVRESGGESELISAYPMGEGGGGGGSRGGNRGRNAGPTNAAGFQGNIRRFSGGAIETPSYDLQDNPASSGRGVDTTARYIERNSGSRGRAARSAAEQVEYGMPSLSTGQSTTDRLVARRDGVISYNSHTQQPNWVAYRITQTDADLSPTRVRAQNAWRPEPTLARQDVPVPSDRDYSGYGGTIHRGHLIENGARQANDGRSEEARVASSRRTFTLGTNTIPQARANNVGPWRHLEYTLQQAASEGATVHVYAGPGFNRNSTPDAIGRNNQIPIPDFTWKVAVIRRPGQTAAQSRVIAVMIPNNNREISEQTPFGQFRVSPGQVEQATGLRFFSNLPRNVATQLRQQVDTADVGQVPELIHQR